MILPSNNMVMSGPGANKFTGGKGAGYGGNNGVMASQRQPTANPESG
jgi:hypothetical protein